MATRTGIFHRALTRIEIDSHVLATLLFRSWSVVAGAVTILLIPFCLTIVQQGYYYTFASILALQVFFELGLGQVIVQIVAHEAAHLHRTDAGEFAGPPERLSRLASMRKLLHQWYLIAALLFLCFVNVLGLFFFRHGELPWGQWAVPWSLLVLATAANLAIGWKIAVVEGFAFVKQVGRLRMVQSMIGFCVMWLGLLLHAGLWVVAVVPATAAVYSWVWLKRTPASDVLNAGMCTTEHPASFSWRGEVFPFQWRIAISWMSGFLIYQLFAPMIFKYHGAAEAGRLGLAISIFNSVVTVGVSWVGAKVPVFAQLLAHGRNADASKLFKRLAMASITFVIVASCALIFLVWVIRRFDLPIAGRLPDLPILMFLAAVSLGNSFVLPAAMFMRAHKEEPLMASAVVMAIATAIDVYVMAPRGAIWVVGGYAILSWTIGVPWTAMLLGNYYRTASVPR